MLTVKTTTRFLKDLKLATKRGRDLDKLEAIVNLLQVQKPLPSYSWRAPEPTPTCSIKFLLSTSIYGMAVFFPALS